MGREGVASYLYPTALHCKFRAVLGLVEVLSQPHAAEGESRLSLVDF